MNTLTSDDFVLNIEEVQMAMLTPDLSIIIVFKHTGKHIINLPKETAKEIFSKLIDAMKILGGTKLQS